MEGGEGEGKESREKRQKSTSCHTTLFQPVCVKECQHLYVAIFSLKSQKEGEALHWSQGHTPRHKRQTAHFQDAFPLILLLLRHSSCNPQHPHHIPFRPSQRPPVFLVSIFKLRPLILWVPKNIHGECWFRHRNLKWARERAITEEWFPEN